jgi:DNA polymerase III subunit delta
MPSKSGTSGAANLDFDPSMRVILIYGKDSLQITETTRRVIETFQKHHGEVERFDYDGETAQLADVLDELRSYGLIQRHKIVVVDNTDKFIGGEEKQHYRRALENYVKEPVDSATLVLRADTWRPGNIDKLIRKVGTICKIEPPNEASSVTWCIDRARERYEAAIDPDAAQLLVTLIGADLARLDMELSKVAAYAGDKRAISRRDVMDLVGMSREDKAWALQQPLAAGDPGGALRMLRELMDISRQPTELITWAICDLLRKLHTASQLVQQGVNTGAIIGKLKLFGESKDAIMTAARRCEPARFAAMLDLAVRTDQRNKSGTGDPIRSLEALTLQIADSMAAAGPRGRR